MAWRVFWTRANRHAQWQDMESLPLLFLGCLAGLSLPMLWRRRRPTREKPQASLVGDDLRRLGPGAVLLYGGQDFVVTRAGRLAAAGPWERIVFLEHAQRPWVLLVAATGQTERLWLLALCPDVLPQPHGSHPAASQKQLAGLHYQLGERYVTTWAALGQSDESVRLDLYRGPGARRLLLIRIGDAATGQGFLGDVVAEAALEVLPATSDGAPLR